MDPQFLEFEITETALMQDPGLGLLLRIQSLDHIYLASALWGIPLLLGAWFIGCKTAKRVLAEA